MNNKFTFKGALMFLGSILVTVAFAQTQTFNYTGSLVNWTVPAGVTSIKIEAYGAQGGGETWNGIYTGGLGAYMSGEFAVTPGEDLKILVGQQGETDASGGGGGGSFVATSLNIPLLVAGGGGGASTDANGVGAVTGTSGTADSEGAVAGGTNGNGGSVCSDVSQQNNGGGGGGFFTDGAENNILVAGNGGKAFINGGTGGAPGRGDGACTADAYGGFGGGGSTTCNTVGGGGGGGYSGGGGGHHFNNCGPANNQRAGGGGGGSFNAGANQSNLAATNSGNGQVIITVLNSSPSPCQITGSIQAYGLKSFWGLPNPNTFYFGVGQWKRLRVNHTGGIGPFTYNWSVTGPGTLIGGGTAPYLFDPTGPVTVSVTITDIGANCQITEDINIAWDDQYFCGTVSPRTWFLKVCDNGVSSCVPWGTAKAMIKNGGAVLGDCAQPTKMATSSTSTNLYPNPTNGSATLEYYLDDAANVGKKSTGTLTVMDINGRVLKRAEIIIGSGKQYQNIDLSGMTSGLYFVQLSTESEVRTEKLQLIK